MENTKSKWFYIFIVMSLVSILLFPPKAQASTNWLKYFRKDSLLNTYKRSYAVFNDTLWIGTHGDGVIINDGSKVHSFTNSNTRTSSTRNDGLVSDYITCVSIDENNGRVWIGTNEGLSSCNIEGKEWKNYTSKDGLPNDFIRDLAIDSSGDLWIGTPSGLVIFDGESWHSFNDTESGQKSIHSIKVKDDSVWVGTVGGSVSRYKEGKWQQFETFQ